MVLIMVLSCICVIIVVLIILHPPRPFPPNSGLLPPSNGSLMHSRHMLVIALSLPKDLFLLSHGLLLSSIMYRLMHTCTLTYTSPHICMHKHTLTHSHLNLGSACLVLLNMVSSISIHSCKWGDPCLYSWVIFHCVYIPQCHLIWFHNLAVEEGCCHNGYRHCLGQMFFNL